MREDDLNAFYGANYSGGSGTTSIDIPGTMTGFPAFVGASPSQAYVGFTFDVRSADGSMVALEVEWPDAKPSKSDSKHKVWRIKRQHKKQNRPAEWHPGGPRLPLDRGEIKEPVFLLLLRDTSNVIHARVLFASELQKELFDLYLPIAGATKSSGLWP
jgi:hypothetical protein